MKNIKRVNTQLSSDSSIKTTVITLSKYDKNQVYHNDAEQIDLIGFDGSLYYYSGHGTRKFGVDDPRTVGDFECLVRKGTPGEQGPKGDNGDTPETPEIRARFDGGKVHIYSYQNGIEYRETTSPDLTGPSWKPKVEDNVLSWERSWDKTTPKSINLDELRPKEGHPVLFRVDSDNTKRSDEISGPARFIQWKYEGQKNWTNLISISELMNLTLAGVSIWYNSEDGMYHFGHREVISAKYDANKEGRRIITDVELDMSDCGILYDAGPIPFPNFELDIEEIKLRLKDAEDEIARLRRDMPSLDGYIKGPLKTINNIPVIGEGNIQFVTINGRSLIGNRDIIIPSTEGFLKANDLKTIARESLVGAGDIKLKTVNNESLIGEGNIAFPNLSEYVKKSEIPTIPSLSDYVKRSDIHLINNQNILDRDVTINVPAGGTQTKLRVSNNILSVSYDDGANWENLGTFGGDGQLPSDIVVDVKIENGKLLVKKDGDSNYTEYNLPSGEGGSACEECFTTDQILKMINVALSGYATKVYVNNTINERIAEAVSGELTINTYRPFSVYTRTSTLTAPSKPGIDDWKWYSTLDNMLHDASKDDPQAGDDDVVNGWSNSVPAATDEKPYLWSSWNIFSDLNGTTDKQWSEPSRMTPEDGTDGVDGDTTKFIYNLVDSRTATVNIPNGNGSNFVEGNGWKDNATGIDPMHPVEFYAYSTYNGRTKTWSSWQGPFKWSVWGENGVDGNGIEYVFHAQASSQVASSLDPSNLSEEIVNSTDYQKAEYLPYKDGANEPWTDEPTGVSADVPYEFVSIRKYQDSKWTAFSRPTLWAHFGKDGVSLVDNYVIVPLTTTVTRTDAGVSGEITFKLFNNGEPRMNQQYGSDSTKNVCAYLGSYSDSSSKALSGGIDNVNNVYRATISNVNSSNNSIQIVWWEGDMDGRILDSAIVPVIVPGASGAQSLDQSVTRIWDYDENTQYYDGTTAVDGVTYLDIVQYEGCYYKCIHPVKGTAPTDSKGNINTDWSRFAIASDSAFNTLLAQNAYIKNLTTKQLVVTNNDNTVVGGMTSGKAINTTLEGGDTFNKTAEQVGDVRIWAGELDNSGNLSTAPFTVTNDGSINATKGKIGPVDITANNLVYSNGNTNSAFGSYGFYHWNTGNNRSGSFRVGYTDDPDVAGGEKALVNILSGDDQGSVGIAIDAEKDAIYVKHGDIHLSFYSSIILTDANGKKYSVGVNTNGELSCEPVTSD